MRRWNILIALAALGSSRAAMAADWWLVDIGSTKPKRQVIFADKASIQKGVGNTLRAWTETYHEDASDGIRTDKTQEEYDCQNRTIKIVSFINYKASGDIFNQDTPSYYLTQSAPVAPDTIGESKLSFVCGQNNQGYQVGVIQDLISWGSGFLSKLDHPTKP